MTLYHFFLFSLFFYTVSTNTCFTPYSLKSCRGRRLDPGTEFCCNNQAYSINSKLCCCVDSISGTETVHTGEMICCGGQLHNKTDRFGELRGCCGNEVYTSSDMENLCCPNANRNHYSYRNTNSNFQPRLHRYNPDLHQKWENIECCGNDVINNLTQKCCNNIINSIEGDPTDWHCCNKTVFNRWTHECNKDDRNNHTVLLKFIKSCNGISYDDRTNKCCNGVLHPNRDVEECCGTQIFNTNTHQCCKAFSFIIPISRLCCGNHSTGSDPFHQRCCENPSNPSSSLIHTFSTPKQQCCGWGLFHPDIEFCCHNQTYSNITHRRCGNQDQCEVISPQDQCCGVRKLHTKTHTCCKGEFLVAKTSSGQDECCYNSENQSGESFSSETHECVRGKVEAKENRCHTQTYDDNSDLCCNNNLYRGDKILGKKCCSYDVYDTHTQRCCSFKVFNGTECPGQNNSICHDLCVKNRRLIVDKIFSGFFNSAICNLKLGYVANVSRQVANFNDGSMKYVIHRPSRNLFTNRREIHHRYLHLPCICKKIFSRMIVITSNPDDKTRELNDFEKDLVLPYSKRIKMAVKYQKKYSCNKYGGNMYRP